MCWCICLRTSESHWKELEKIFFQFISTKTHYKININKSNVLILFLKSNIFDIIKIGLCVPQITALKITPVYCTYSSIMLCLDLKNHPSVVRQFSIPIAQNIPAMHILPNFHGKSQAEIVLKMESEEMKECTLYMV